MHHGSKAAAILRLFFLSYLKMFYLQTQIYLYIKRKIILWFWYNWNDRWSLKQRYDFRDHIETDINWVSKIRWDFNGLHYCSAEIKKLSVLNPLPFLPVLSCCSEPLFCLFWSEADTGSWTHSWLNFVQKMQEGLLNIYMYINIYMHLINNTNNYIF